MNEREKAAVEEAVRRQFAETKGEIAELSAWVGKAQQEADRTLEMLCDQKFERVTSDGSTERYMQERGLDYGDAVIALAEEVYAPLDEARRRRRESERQAEQLAEQRQLAQEFGVAEAELAEELAEPPAAVTILSAAEERAEQGFSDEDVRERARARGVGYVEACEELLLELSEKESAKRARVEEAARERTRRELIELGEG